MDPLWPGRGGMGVTIRESRRSHVGQFWGWGVGAGDGLRARRVTNTLAEQLGSMPRQVR